ncbi:hypothetical protein MES5069_190015 [Mesorhizobium escarrei]|nr:hypothetical protein MES5069_190015 [Mesorhizobium escarrei]
MRTRCTVGLTTFAVSAHLMDDRVLVRVNHWPGETFLCRTIVIDGSKVKDPSIVSLRGRKQAGALADFPHNWTAYRTISGVAPARCDSVPKLDADREWSSRSFDSRFRQVR